MKMGSNHKLGLKELVIYNKEIEKKRNKEEETFNYDLNEYL